jgi:hypothetical protein
MVDIFRYVSCHEKNFDTYSVVLESLLIDTCSFFDSSCQTFIREKSLAGHTFKQESRVGDFEKKVSGSAEFNFGDYRQLLEGDFVLSKMEVNLNPYEDALYSNPMHYLPDAISGYLRAEQGGFAVMTQQINGYIFLLRVAFLGAILLVGTSCSDSAQQQTNAGNGQKSKPLTYAKCDEIDISLVASPTCSVNKKKYEEITWENKGTQDLYMCIDPTDDLTTKLSLNPFWAYAWYVKSGAFVKSGMIKLEIPIGSTQYNFYSSPNPCSGLPTPINAKNRSTPHVVIE